MSGVAKRELEDGGRVKRPRGVLYRYLENEPVGAVVAGLLIVLGLFSVLGELARRQPALAVVFVLAIAVAVILLVSDRARKLALGPAIASILIGLALSQSIYSLAQKLLG
jgi:asparagine N-glycosylation enzyme membrane subunit Stt3